jgi:hypothetical protein
MWETSENPLKLEPELEMFLGTPRLIVNILRISEFGVSVLGTLQFSRST